MDPALGDFGWAALHSRPFCVGLEATGGLAEGDLPSPQGWAWQRGRASPLEGPFVASFVLLREEAKLRTEVDGENLGLGFDKR